MRQKGANLLDSVDLVRAQHCQVDLTHAETSSTSVFARTLEHR